MTTIDQLDEFAKAALTGLLANERLAARGVQELARSAYEIAEAMEAEREHVLDRRRSMARTTLGSRCTGLDPFNPNPHEE